MSTNFIREEYPKVARTPTYVLKCGDISTNKTLALIIPGNPGHGGYYKEYMKALYKGCDGKLPVWCVSHAGHGILPAYTGTDDNNVCYYGMRDQIWHKLCFIRDYIPADTRLILIGHSIGSYFILHMMEELEPNRVLKAMLLFPTIERIALSSSGKSLTTFVKYFGWLAPLPMYPVFYLTPATIKEIVLRWYFKGKDIPDSVIETTQLISDPKSFRNFVSMGNEELQNVVHADYHIIEKNLSKLMIYYGARDHWCPVEYYEDMKAKYPNGDIRLCKGNYDHAFILEHSKPVAEICCQFIQEHIHLDQTDSL